MEARFVDQALFKPVLWTKPMPRRRVEEADVTRARLEEELFSRDQLRGARFLH